MAVASEACACVAAGFAVDEAVGAVVQQAVCFGGSAFAHHGGDQCALAVCVQLCGAAAAAQAVGVFGAAEQPGGGALGGGVAGEAVLCVLPKDATQLIAARA